MPAPPRAPGGGRLRSARDRVTGSPARPPVVVVAQSSTRQGRDSDVLGLVQDVLQEVPLRYAVTGRKVPLQRRKARKAATRDRVPLHIADTALVLALGACPIRSTGSRPEPPM